MKILSIIMSGALLLSMPNVAHAAPVNSQDDPSIVGTIEGDSTDQPSIQVEPVTLIQTSGLTGVFAPNGNWAYTANGMTPLKINGSLSGVTPENPRQVLLQKKTSTGTWSTVHTVQLTDKSGSFSIIYQEEWGYGSFRAHSPESSTHTALTGKEFPIEDARATYKTEWKNTKTMNQLAGSTLGFQGDLVFTHPGKSMQFSLNYTLWRKVNNGPQQIVSSGEVKLNQYNPSKTVTVQDYKQNISSGTVTYGVTIGHPAPAYNKYVNLGTAPNQVMSYNPTKTQKVTLPTQLNGKTNTLSRTLIAAGATVEALPFSRTAGVQVYNTSTKKWVDAGPKTAIPANRTGIAVYIPSDTNPRQYRFVLYGTGDYKPYYGPSTTINRTKSKSSVHASLTRPSAHVPWTHNTISTRVAAGTTKVTFAIQKYNASKKTWETWKTVKNVKAGTYKYNLPKGNTKSNTQTVKYRVVLSGSATHHSATSATLSDKWENPHKYTGKQKTIYSYSKHQCPNDLIRVKNLGKNIWGMAHYGIDAFDVSTSVPAQHLKSVALHECAHLKQFKHYLTGATEWNKFSKKMNSIYGGTGTLGIERHATCISSKWAKLSYYAYEPNCNGGERHKAAQTIASGKKYKI